MAASTNMEIWCDQITDPKIRRLPPVIASGGGGDQIIGFDGTMPGYFKRRIVYAI